MAELDFSKIFGETATSKASFTDENYLNGWGYLGSTPPPYQLFDYLQSLNDKKSKYLYDNINENKNNLLTHNTASSAHADIRQMFNNYLPLTGGTVTGALNVPTQPTTDNSTKVANTAFVQSAHAPILNAIKAISGMSAYDIAPSKTIAAIIPLLGFGGIVAQKLETNGYIKFANGVTIQWGVYDNIPTGTQINFPIAFTTSNAQVTTNGLENSNRNAIQVFAVHSVTSTGFKVLSKRFDNSITNDYGRFIAVGY